MDNFTFQGLGTDWYIAISGDSLKEDVKTKITGYVKTFEATYSRFLLDSENNRFRSAEAGEYIVSKEFLSLLELADRLRTLTSGTYDPGIGMLLESTGYGAKSALESSGKVDAFKLPKWSIGGKKLIVDGPIVFDFGGFGKGYCIDQIVNILKESGYKNFLVDGGGDMFATTKEDSSPWNIAIEYPGKPDTALGRILLKNRGIAVSDSFRRQWGKWHHLVNPQQKEIIMHTIGAVAVADSACNADCMTSALFFSESGEYRRAANQYNAEYLVIRGGGLTEVSPLWSGELF